MSINFMMFIVVSLILASIVMNVYMYFANQADIDNTRKSLGAYKSTSSCDISKMSTQISDITKDINRIEVRLTTAKRSREDLKNDMQTIKDKELVVLKDQIEVLIRSGKTHESQIKGLQQSCIDVKKKSKKES